MFFNGITHIDVGKEIKNLRMMKHDHPLFVNLTQWNFARGKQSSPELTISPVHALAIARINENWCISETVTKEKEYQLNTYGIVNYI